jgi:dUTP pyrophosphatase
MEILLKHLDPGLPVPSHANAGDAGVDLRAREPIELGPGSRAVVPTGIAVAIPEGYAGLVTPRSGLAARSGVGIVNSPGVVDSGYRGEISVVLINQGNETVRFDRGDRIAQLLVVEVQQLSFSVVESLPESARGPGGFGSTGI